MSLQDLATSVSKSLYRFPQMLQSMSSSTSDSADEDVKPTFKDPVDQSLNSDPSVNIATLPDDHPIHLLGEARRCYQGVRPPFVLRNRAESTRNVVIPTASGKRPAVPKRVKVVAKPWDDKSMLWTLDLNGIRYIVKPFGGAPQAGAKYLYWAGPAKGFEQRPLAFTELNPRPFHDIQGPPLEESSEESDDEIVLLNQRGATSRRLDTTVINVPEDKSANDETRTLGQTSLHLGVPTPSDSEVALRPIDGNANFEMTQNNLKKSKRPSRHSDLPSRLAKDMDDTIGSQPRKRRKTDISSKEINRLRDHSSPSPPRSRRPRTQTTDVRHRGSSPLMEPSNAQAPQSNRKVSTISHRQQPSAGSTVLSREKRNHTTMIVRVAPSPVFQPMKLSDCPNAETFYSQVLSLWEISSSDVYKVTVTFTWMDMHDRLRTMVVNPQLESSFVYLLEQVDEAPCWDVSNGKCVFDVDIFRKSIGGRLERR